jgi:hypothetical protein
MTVQTPRRIGRKNHIITAAALGILIPGMADAAERCTPIRFAPGALSATVRGIARSMDEGNKTTCYTLATAGGQTATLAIQLRGPKDDTAFTIVDVVDNRDKYTFRTEAKTYEIGVYLTFARQADRPFAMDVSVR